VKNVSQKQKWSGELIQRSLRALSETKKTRPFRKSREGKASLLTRQIDYDRLLEMSSPLSYLLFIIDSYRRRVSWSVL
jgi:hypothetical protein